jgi:hypothetical protein
MDRFAALRSGGQSNGDDHRRQHQPGQYAGPAITRPVVRCRTRRMRKCGQHRRSRKRLWRQPNNPMAPRKVPSGCKNAPGDGFAARRFLLVGNPDAMRSVALSTFRLNARA